MLSFLAEVQCVHGLLVVREILRHGADNGCLRISSERRLEDAGHFAVTVVDESLAVALRQLVNNVGEGKQTSVDVAAFTQAETISLRFANAFAACQVDQVQLGHFDLLARSALRVRLDVNSENGVRP